MTEKPTLQLVRSTGQWADDDPDANFKADIALRAHVDDEGDGET